MADGIAGFGPSQRNPLGMSWRWRLNRLRTMGAAEVGYRIRSAIQARLEAISSQATVICPPPSRARGVRWIAQSVPTGVDVAAVRSVADSVLAGRFDVFAMRGTELGFPPIWLRDPKTGRQSPVLFGKSIDYRSQAVVGDIKYLWEPSRHLEAVTLAQAYALTGIERYAAGVRTLLESWFTQCPYPFGVHWASSLELAVRLVNWSVAWQLLEASSVFDGKGGATFRSRWLDNIYLHQRFIAGHLSKYSSANNHLFGEYMGLFIAAVTWPCWPESGNWRIQSQTGLEAESLKQNAPDGVNREQAIWYHHEVTDMMLMCGLAGRAAGSGLSGHFWTRLEAMLGFVSGVMDFAGNVPMIGDADDAVMVRFVPKHDFNVFRSLLATGAVLFNRADFARIAISLDDKSRWLLGDEASTKFDQLLEHADLLSCGRTAGGRAFPHGGYYVLGDRLGTADEVRLVADAGPLGYLSIAAHGHADALALTLSVGGNEILIDPGTYTYHSEQGWRDYFKGTSAHNTVRIDGQDQSLSAGNFMWLRHARAQCQTFETSADQDRFVGSHDGYRRLSDPLTHRRQITLNKLDRTLYVTDELVCHGSHEVEVFWHFAENCAVQVEAGSIAACLGRVHLDFSLTGIDFKAECVIGQLDPPLGWISRKYDAKCPSPTVRWHGRIEGCTQWTTRIAIAVQA